MATIKTEFFPSFSWAVPLAFADPLGTSRFEQGDTIYEKQSAYELPWSEVCKAEGRSIQVISPTRGVTSKISGKSKSTFEDNWKQKVIFELRDLKAGDTSTITTSQGCLYTFLWRGEIAVLNEKTKTPPVPRLASMLKKHLSEAVNLFQVELLPDPDEVRFFMPCDLAAGLYRDKFLAVKNILETKYNAGHVLEPAGMLGGKEPFLPTVYVAAFSIRGTSAEQVEKTLKEVLYQPMPGRKGVARFRLNTHGLLL